MATPEEIKSNLDQVESELSTVNTKLEHDLDKEEQRFLRQEKLELLKQRTVLLEARHHISLVPGLQGLSIGPAGGAAAADTAYAGDRGLSAAAPEPVIRYWRALQNAKMTGGGFLELPSGTYIMGDEERGNVLFIRRCYRAMFERMKHLWESKTNKRFLITGTPGIGKTCFAVPLMGWLFQEKMASKIVLELDQQRYLFTTDNVMEGSNSDFRQELGDSRVWWIVDMGTVFKRRANTVLLASPDRERYKEFLKLLGATTLYMPVWLDDEIKICRLRIFPNLDAALVEVLQSKWGNIPRYILEKAEDFTAQASLDRAISTCSWEDLLRCIGEPDSGPHASHKLLHLDVTSKDYNAIVMKLASPYVAREVEQQAGSAHVQRLKELVLLSLGTPAYAAAAGAFFENYGHRLLQRGGTFEVRRLRKSEEVGPTTLVLQTVPSTHVFNKLEEMKEQKDGVYCIPRVHNFPAVDAIMQPESLFQMTIAQKRTVNESGLKKAARQLRGAKRLYFVVPTSMFTSYSFVDGLPQDVEQWVLDVKWV